MARRDARWILAALVVIGSIPAVSIASVSGDPLAKTVSIDVQEAHLTNVLRMMADDTGLNVILDPAVDRKITLKLGNVTWRQFLDLSLKLYGLRAEYQGNVVLVAPGDSAAFRRPEPSYTGDRFPILKLVPVRYADAKQLGALVQRTVLSKEGWLEVDERTNTLLIKDYPERIDEAVRLIGHD